MMISDPTISVMIVGQKPTDRCTGLYSAPASAVDRCIATYLPDSPAGLRNTIAMRVDCDPEDLRHIADVSTLLLILADFDQQEFRRKVEAQVNPAGEGEAS